MFVTMAVDHLFAFFIILLICNTGFSAEISVFVKTGDPVHLDIHTQKLPEFDLLSWTNDKSETIVRYISETEKVKLHSSYKDRVDFNTETFSLTLKNMQKTDSGLYRATASGESENIIVTYRVSVIDAVEAPVLTVNSNWSSSDSCTVNFTCRAQDLMIHSRYQNNRCSPEEVKSQLNTLTLNCSEESIICNHNNPVSSKQERINIKQLCVYNNKENDPTYIQTLPMWPYILMGMCLFLAIVIFFSVFLYCKYKKGVKQSDDTDYDDVETLMQKMTGDTWTTITYRTVGHRTPSSAHDC